MFDRSECRWICN